MSRLGLIYGYVNLKTKKWYVGECYQDREKDRQSSHKSKFRAFLAGKKEHLCLKFYRSVKKHGWDSFEYVVLEKDIPSEELHEKEVTWSNKLNSIERGYNSKVGGGGKAVVSEEARKNYRDSKLGRLNPNFVSVFEYETREIDKHSFRKKCEVQGVNYSDFKIVDLQKAKWGKRMFNFVFAPNSKNSSEALLPLISKKSRKKKTLQSVTVYETKSTTREKFKKYCERTSLDFNNFKEVVDLACPATKVNNFKKKFFYFKIEEE